MELTHVPVLCFQQFGSVRFMSDPHSEPILWDRTYKSRRFAWLDLWTNVEILVLLYSEKTLVIWWTFNGRKDGSRRELLTREAWGEGHNALSPDNSAFPVEQPRNNGWDVVIALKWMVEFAFQQNAPTPGNICDISHASFEQEIALQELPPIYIALFANVVRYIVGASVCPNNWSFFQAWISQ